MLPVLWNCLVCGDHAGTGRLKPSPRVGFTHVARMHGRKRDNNVALVRIKSYGLTRGQYWPRGSFSVAPTLNRNEQEW